MQIGRNVHDIQNKVAVYDSRNKKSKVVSIFWYDSKYDKFSNSSAKFTHFEIFIFIQQWLTQNMWSIGPTISILDNKL